MKKFPECEKSTKNPVISLKDNRSEIIFKNPERLEICIVTVDNCAIQEGIRCGYALTIENSKEEFYLELKGHDVEHALDQIEATIKTISSDPQKSSKTCFVISTRCPPGANTKIASRKQAMKKKYHATLIIKNTPHTYTIEPSS
jgi:hypothetical protein